MMKLSGLGIWISDWSQCEGGHLPSLVGKAKASGVSWVALQAGEATSKDPLTRERVHALRAAGIECAAWWLSRPASAAAEIALLRDLVANQGVRHLIQHAEPEWERVNDSRGYRVANDL